MEPHPIIQSLLATTTTTTTTSTIYGVGGVGSSPAKSVYPSIILKLPWVFFRVVLILFIGIISLWANYEASKGFSITIANDASTSSLSQKRFALFYESNDKASRIILNTSTFVENILYPSENFKHVKKQINGVTLRLASKNIPSIVSVDSLKPHEYMISLSPSLMESYSNNAAVQLAVLKGMARVWLWDENRATPPVLLDGMVEYMSSLAGFTMTEIKSSNDANTSQEKSEVCWKDKDPRKVAGFLRHCDQIKREGGGGGGGEVIRRLNERMRNKWHDSMMDDALDMSGQHACATYHMKMLNNYPSSSI